MSPATSAAAQAGPSSPEPLPDALAEMSRALDRAGLGFTVADSDVRGFPLVHVNDRFCAMVGRAPDDVLGRPCSFLQTPRTKALEIARLSRALREGRAEQVVLLNVTAGGEEFFNELRLLAPQEHDGRRYVAAVQNDVTASYRQLLSLGAERDAYQRQLAQTRGQLDAAAAELVDLRKLQRALSPPEATGTDTLRVATRFRPVEHGVAGDFYVTLPQPDGSLVLAVGDVCGHGVESPRRAAFVRASLVAFAGHVTDPAQLLRLANHSLIERGGMDLRFVTCACVHLRVADGGLQADVALAGHPVPRRLSDGQPVVEAPPRGVPLGLDTDWDGRAFTVSLDAHDGLLLHTDGITEARPPGSPDLFGDERLSAAIARHAADDVDDLLGQLLAAVTDHANGSITDDLCLLAAAGSAVSTRP